MTSQKFKTTMGVRPVREIGRQEVIDTIDIDMYDVLQVWGIIDDFVDRAACSLRGEQTHGREVSQNLDEQFCRKIKKGAGQICRGASGNLTHWHSFVFALWLCWSHRHNQGGCLQVPSSHIQVSLSLVAWSYLVHRRLVLSSFLSTATGIRYVIHPKKSKISHQKRSFKTLS